MTSPEWYLGTLALGGVSGIVAIATNVSGTALAVLSAGKNYCSDRGPNCITLYMMATLLDAERGETLHIDASAMCMYGEDTLLALDELGRVAVVDIHTNVSHRATATRASARDHATGIAAAGDTVLLSKNDCIEVFVIRFGGSTAPALQACTSVPFPMQALTFIPDAEIARVSLSRDALHAFVILNDVHRVFKIRLSDGVCVHTCVVDSASDVLQLSCDDTLVVASWFGSKLVCLREPGSATGAVEDTVRTGASKRLLCPRALAGTSRNGVVYVLDHIDRVQVVDAVRGLQII